MVDHYQSADFQALPPCPESGVPGAIFSMLSLWSMLGERVEMVVNDFMQGVGVGVLEEAFSPRERTAPQGSSWPGFMLRRGGTMHHLGEAAGEGHEGHWRTRERLHAVVRAPRAWE